MRAIVILTALVAAAGCKKNPAYCAVGGPDCATGYACDTTAHECHPIVGGGEMGGGGGDMASGCAQACGDATPICVAPDCQACTAQSDPEAACAAIDATTPHCLTMGGAAGSCVGCRDGGDCAAPTPFCDATTHQCRGCIANSECASMVCDLEPGSASYGRCADATQVVYVDNSKPKGTGLTPDSPLDQIMDGVNTATANNRLYVHVAATATAYNKTVATMDAQHPVFVVADPGAVLDVDGGDGLGAHKGATLKVMGLDVEMAPGNGASVTDAGSKLYLYRVTIAHSGQDGIYAKDSTLVVDGCWVSINATGGITLDGAGFSIVNSVISGNGGSGGLYQLNVPTAGQQLFVNNTVANNPSNSAQSGGVSCVTGGPTLVNTILFGNLKGTVLSETNCAVSSVATDDPTLAMMSGNVDLTVTPPGFAKATPQTLADYHLTPTSPCRDKGTSTGAPDHDLDLERRPDAAAMKVDIGADEVP